MVLTLMFALAVSAADSSVIEHTQHTAAPPAAVWDVWTDVPRWPQWDSGLTAATLEGPWQTGARGRLTPDKGPKASFRVLASEANREYVLQIPLPLGRMVLTRTIVNSGPGGTTFRHRVQITGVARLLFKGTLRRYHAMLPEVTAAVARQAEARAASL